MTAPVHTTTTTPVARRLDVGGGHHLATLDWGGAGPLVLLHHATGFCAGTWSSVATQLSGDCRVVAFDARGHGQSDRPVGEGAYDWWHMADDLAALTEQVLALTGRTRVELIVGHSFGGIVALGALSRHAPPFERVLLLDPALVGHEGDAMPPPPARLAALARTRRAVFASREQALERWRQNAFFKSWDPRVLEDYARYGLCERDDGSVELCCPPEVEAAVFTAGGTIDVFAVESWPAIPVRIHWSSRDNFSRAACERLAGRMPDGSVHTVDAGHLVPMEAPGHVAALIRDFLG